MVASCPKCLSSTSNQKGQKARRHCMIPQPNAGSGCTTGKLGNTVSHCRNSGKCVRLLGRVLKQVPCITPCPASSRPTPGETIRRVNGPQMKPSNRIRIIVFFTALLFSARSSSAQRPDTPNWALPSTDYKCASISLRQRPRNPRFLSLELNFAMSERRTYS